MIKFDFHGMDKEELEMTIDLFVGTARINGSQTNYEFITGEGVLKDHLKKYLKDQYGLDYREAHNCAGYINVTVE